MRPVRGALVVNAGDLISRWTNGVWKSNTHRVVNPPARPLACAGQEDEGGNQDGGGNEGGSVLVPSRYSVVFFTGPRHDTVITPLPTCVTASNPSRFPEITAGEHLQMKLRCRQACRWPRGHEGSLRNSS